MTNSMLQGLIALIALGWVPVLVFSIYLTRSSFRAMHATVQLAKETTEESMRLAHRAKPANESGSPGHAHRERHQNGPQHRPQKNRKSPSTGTNHFAINGVLDPS